MNHAAARGPGSAAGAPLLEVRDLEVDYPIGRKRTRRVIDGVSLAVMPGETLGVVGESGSGKSTLGKALLGLAPFSGGRMSFAGAEIDPRGARPANLLRELQVVFQDPYSSLDPTKRIGYSIAEPLLTLGDGRGGLALTRTEARIRVAEMLERVGLSADAAERYPAQFSGGQLQRIAIARALIVKPRLVICDEILSALDLSVQAQIINLLQDLQRDLGLSYLFISHDLSVVEYLAHQVLVLFRGRIMEHGPGGLVHVQAQHPYTRTLIASALLSDPKRQRQQREARGKLKVEAGPIQPLGERCPFLHRCPLAVGICASSRPELLPNEAGTLAACHLRGGMGAFRS